MTRFLILIARGGHSVSFNSKKTIDIVDHKVLLDNLETDKVKYTEKKWFRSVLDERR